MARPVLRTVEDFERAYGSPWGRLAYNDQGLRKHGGLEKADQPLQTGTSGSFQFVVGAKLWAQLNTEQNIFAAIPKEEWNYSGIRVITGYPTDKAVGVAEGGTIPDTQLPGFAQYQPKVKVMARGFDSSLQQMFLAQRGEGVTWEQFRDFMGVTYGKGVNESLLQDVDTLAGDDFESIDRIATSNSEVSGLSLDSGDGDLYGSLDRDSASWADGTSLHNSGTDRTLSLSLLNDLWRTVNENVGDYNMGNYFWFTGPDTYQRWGELLQPQQRFSEEVASFSPMNGVEVGMTPTHSASFRVGVYERAPILVSNDVASDTISRTYLLHKDFLRMRIVQPVVYREVGVSTGQELLLNKFGDEGLWYSGGELVTYFPASSGKLRDLK